MPKVNPSVLSSILGGIGLPAGMDYLQHDNYTDWDKWRVGNMLMNAAIGAGAGHLAGKGELVQGLTAATLAPAKDLLINAQETPKKINELADTVGQLTKKEAPELKLGPGAIALGAGALGLGALGIAKYLMSKDPKTDMGTMKIKLPGKKNEPGTEAEVTLPVDLPEMSPSMIEGLNKGVRLQARKNIKANSFKRDLVTGKLIPAEEWDKLYRNEDGTVREMDKAASDQRSWAEGAGSVITGLGSSLLGSILGGHLAQSSTNPHAGTIGSIAGAALGAVTPALLGRLLAQNTKQRTQKEQDAHDRGSAFEEYLIPGYASYNAAKREQGTREEEDEKAKELNRLSFANTLSSDASFSDDWDDEYLDKYAGMMMPPPPGPMMPPPPIDKKTNRPVPAGSTPPPAVESREIPTGSLKDTRRKAKKLTRFSVEKKASAAARQEVLGIMDRIYAEDPSYWPYGLGIPGHESVYLIRDNMTKAAAGFVGWQESYENGRKIGSYSIGILPEYRKRGFAKEAVAKVIREKSARVDEVRAYIVHGNKPSRGLADSLGVNVKEDF